METLEKTTSQKISTKTEQKKDDIFDKLYKDAKKRHQKLEELTKKRQEALERKMAKEYFKPKISEVPKYLSKNNGKEKDDVFTRLYKDVKRCDRREKLKERRQKDLDRKMAEECTFKPKISKLDRKNFSKKGTRISYPNCERDATRRYLIRMKKATEKHEKKTTDEKNW